jgi:hypothetical protein
MLIELTLNRAASKGHIKAWMVLKNGDYHVHLDSNHAYTYGGSEIIAFCHGLLAAT